MSTRRSARLNGASQPPKEESKPLKESPTMSKLPATSKKRKAPPSKDNHDVRSTPKRKKLTKKELNPVTPTPAAVSLMSLPYSTGDIDDSTPPSPINRLALPEGTNAPLLTPENHHLITNKAVDQVSPSKVGNIKTTTTNILDEAIAHLLKTEPKLKSVIEKFPCHVFSPEGLTEEIDPFRALVSGIISQQVSGAAAKSIKAKFTSLFNPPPYPQIFPTPTLVSTTTLTTLRTAGLSQRKAEYIHGLAQKFVSGELTTSFLFSASYEEVLEALLKVRGLGRWSVEMFACFALKRLDVFSTGDLGVQRGMAWLVERDVRKIRRGGGGGIKGKDGKGKGGGKWKYMSEKDMLEGADRFRPFRSVFMWYMWRVEDVDVGALDGS